MIDAQPEATPLTPQEQHVRRAHLTVCLTLLALLAAAYLTTATLVADRLPQRVPVHFGVDGVADGWLDRWVALVAFGLLSLGLPLLLLVVFAVGQWWRGSSARFTSALVCAVAVGLVALFVALLWSVADATTEVTLSAWFLLGPLALAVVAGLLVSLVLPPSLPQPEPVVAQPLDIAPSDRVSWFGRASSSQPLVLALLAGVLVVVGALHLLGEDGVVVINRFRNRHEVAVGQREGVGKATVLTLQPQQGARAAMGAEASEAQVAFAANGVDGPDDALPRQFPWIVAVDRFHHADELMPQHAAMGVGSHGRVSIECRNPQPQWPDNRLARPCLGSGMAGRK